MRHRDIRGSQEFKRTELYNNIVVLIEYIPPPLNQQDDLKKLVNCILSKEVLFETNNKQLLEEQEMLYEFYHIRIKAPDPICKPLPFMNLYIKNEKNRRENKASCRGIKQNKHSKNF